MKKNIASVLLGMSLVIHPALSDTIDSNALAVAQTFSTALQQFDNQVMVNTLHPDMIEFFQKMVFHIAETTTDSGEQKDFLEFYGVDSVDTLKSIPPTQVVIKFYDMVFGQMTDEARQMSADSEIKIVGSVPEDDVLHVFYRLNVGTEDITVSVPSVITLKKYYEDWKVINTTQLEKVKAKAIAQGLIK